MTTTPIEPPNEPLTEPEIVPSGDPVGPGTIVPSEPQPPATEPEPLP